MAAHQDKIDIYLESGQKRVLAVAIDWPGWCRRGKDDESAMEALLQAAPRYAQILRPTGLPFPTPNSPGQLRVRERVDGGAGVDMGIPSTVLASDAEPMKATELELATKVLRAVWEAFEKAVESAKGKELRKGTRGGGRELEGIMRHVTEAESAYVGMVGIKVRQDDLAENADARGALAASHERVLEGLSAVAPIGTPPPGPRGGARWPARYFVRRVAYHVVDHTWEIEDRLQPLE